jgi:tetratricopeptide (TPR) repeat protein
MAVGLVSILDRSAQPLRAITVVSLSLSLLILGACEQEKIEAQKYINRGVVALERGEPEVAFDFFSQATALDPTNARGHYHLGLVYAHEKNRPAEARVAFQEALELTPEDGDMLFQLGALARQEGKPKEATELLKRALPRMADPAEVHYQLALMAETRADLPAMDGHLRDAIKADTTFTKAYLALATLYYDLNEIARAARVVDEGLHVPLHTPESAQLLFLHACLLKQQGRVREAILALEEGLKLDPHDAEAYFDLGYLQANTKRYRAAIYQLEQYINKANESNPTRVRLARRLVDKLWTEIDRHKDGRDPELNLH